MNRVAGAALLACAGGAWACDGPAAKLVSLEGTVEVRAAGSGAWQPATPAQALCTGDTLAVRALGRAAVALPNEVVLRLDQGSVLTLKSFANEQPSELGLLQGALHVLTRFSKRFGVVTPYLNAMVDGTEFTVRVAEGATSVSVHEGRVSAENSAGQQKVTAGSSARAAQGQAPVALTLQPRDAVQWALYFPQIVQSSPTVVQGLPAAAQQAAQLASQGQYSQALAAWPAEVDALRNERAGWLLGVGRIAEAEALLPPADAAGTGPAAASALAVRALLQVVRYQTDEALATAQRAVASDPQSAAAQLALSYAWQARRDLPAALAAAQQAVMLEPAHALAWARLAELQLSSGLLREGEASAGRALAVNPRAPRAQTLLGFAQLLRGRDAQAQGSLEQAQALSPSDPLPHLGLGLSLLRSGKVAEGRREMEIAVMLDPGDAELRALLARAYLGERRDRLAADEIGIAKALDPRSPTPWFLDGQLKQRANRPVEAAADYERALALNDQRAVVRPNSLLDTDRAARTAALASVWRDLGFEGALLSAGRRALTDDPQNEAAHRLLAEAYASSPRYETARVSELLQAQLRQSPRTEPVAPQELQPGLPVLNGPQTLALQETGPLFDESRGGARLGLMGGNRGLFGSAATVWRSVGDGQISLGHFHYETDGFRSGADLKLDANNVLWQTALTPELNGQFEVRSTRREGGDITQRLLAQSATPETRRDIDVDTWRVGLRYLPTSESEWIGSAVHIERDSNSIDVSRNGALKNTTNGTNDRSGLLTELMYTTHASMYNLTSGLSRYREDLTSITTTTITGLPVTPRPFVSRSSPSLKHDLGFLNLVVNARPVTLHAGLSRDEFSRGIVSVRQTSPRFGLGWQLNDSWLVRMASIKAVKGATAKEQTVEPTQFAGFNQLFDDPEGTKSRRQAVGLEKHFTGGQLGVEISRRHLQIPAVLTTPIPSCRSVTTVCDVQWTEAFNRAYWGQTLNARLSGSVALEYETQALYTAGASNLPASTRTWQMPLRLNYFPTEILSLYGEIRRVEQSASFSSGAIRSASDRFWITNVGLRIEPSPRTSVLIDVNNLFNQEFRFQNTYLSGEPRVPLFQPGRTIMGRAEIRF